MKKPISIASVLFGVILLAGCATSPSVKEQPMAIEGQPVVQPSDNMVAVGDWETYKNDRYGFKFDHPNSWLITSETCVAYQADCDGVLYEIGIGDGTDNGPLASGIRTIVLPTADRQEAGDFIKNTIFNDKWFSFQKDDGDTQVYSFVGTSTSEFTVKFIPHLDKTYVLAPILGTLEAKLDYSTYDHVLSTFGFTE